MVAACWAVAGGLLASSVGAQSAADATLSAADGFGETVGLNQIGIYNAGNIRGFDPTNSAAYRIDGAYFAHAGDLSDGAIDGVAIRVGTSATRLTYPSPSGIIDYQLRSYKQGDRWLNVGVGTYAWYAPALELNFSAASANGRAGIAGGAEIRPTNVYPKGSRGSEYFVGAVPEWRPSDRLRARAVLSYGHVTADHGLWSDFIAGQVLPPAPAMPVLLPPPSAAAHEYQSGVGGLVDYSPSRNWKVSAAAFASADGFSYDYTAFIYDLSPFVHASLTHHPQQFTRANSAELRVARDITGARATHRLSWAVRFRNKQVTNSDERAVDLGTIDRRNPVYPDVPAYPDDGRRSRDVVKQLVASIDYSATLEDRLELRMGLDVTDREERFFALSGESASARLRRGFPHASVVWSLNSRTAFFSSFVKGVEDSGIAPYFAANENQVLPAVIARQWELGARMQLTPSVGLIIAGFDTRKPTAGLRPDLVYTLVGDERHAGIELSLSGQVDSRTRIVLGAVDMTQELSGPLVEGGSIGRRPVGVSPAIVSATVVRQLARRPAWSLDAQLRWSSGKYIDSQNSLRTPSVALLDVGARRQFRFAGSPAELRLSATNLFNRRAWDAYTTGDLLPLTRRTVGVWAAVNLTLGTPRN
jgi:iron complex outermembrane receptor protein